MEILKVYKTSYGYFFNEDEASKKQNRLKEYGSRIGDPVGYERVKEVFVIRAESNLFELTHVEVK